MNSQELDALLNNGHEHEQLEFKKAKTKFDREKLLQYCAAIANKLGGKLILGVSEKHPRVVEGTDAFRNLNEIKENIYTELELDVRIDEIKHSNGRVLVFNIPSRDKGDIVNLRGTLWSRAGESLVPMNNSEIRRIFAENAKEWINEDALSNLNKTEIIEKLDTVTYYRLQEINLPSNNDEIIRRLQSDNLIKSSKNNFTITNLGAILLAHDLNDFQNLNYVAPRIIEYNDNSKINLISDYTIEKGYANGFEETKNYIVNNIPQKEITVGARRILERLVTPVMIREILANALIHQDFNIVGIRPMIEIHPDRVEISNPGLPLSEFDRFIESSETRNDPLIKLMRKCNLSEESSSGIDKVFTEIEKNQLLPLGYQQGVKTTKIILYGKKDFNDLSYTDKINACYQHCSLKYVNKDRMTNSSLRIRFGLPSNKSDVVSRIIKGTIDKGLIKLDESEYSSRKFANYLPYWA